MRAAASAEEPARVVDVGSVDGIRVPSMDNFSDSASKAGLHQLTRHLAIELVGDHVHVDAIAPVAGSSRG
ncbi:MAG: SDR family NAD(P)-dependent oxidoreductase [Bacteroidales bacterium]|nr:SDR family NAD(P)-dependent oxidoreductase [Bacteroidales bacterium]